MKRLLLLFVLLPALLFAQSKDKNPEDQGINLDTPTFVPLVKVSKAMYEGDSIQYVELNRLYIYPPKEFKNEKARKQYNKLVYNVKKVLPIAKEVRQIVIETYDVVSTIKNKKDRQAHLKQVEKDIYADYAPRMKKLTRSQGKLLIKLVYRECNSTGYQLVKAFLGPIRAGFYQAFAWTFGASLMKEYEPEGSDKELEMIVKQVEAGQI